MSTSFMQNLYRNFFDAYKRAYPNLRHNDCDQRVSELWRNLKKDKDFPRNVDAELKKLQQIVSKRKSTLMSYLQSVPAKKASFTTSDPDAQNISTELTPKSSPQNLLEAESDPIPESNDQSSDVGSEPLSVGRVYDTPKQAQLSTDITSLSLDIGYLEAKKEKGLASDDDRRRLKELISSRKEKEKQLKILKSNQINSQKSRKKKQLAISEVVKSHPEASEALQIRANRGRPRVEEKQPDFLQAIVDIATYGASAEERRRSEEIRSVKTLNDLASELEKLGYNISRQSVYYRLLPKRANSSEGKRHIVTVPVRLARATHDFHKYHADTSFCKTAIGYLETLASILGPKKVLFLSQDDKARVPIGKTAASKESPILMSVEYRVRLPDHDWVVADRHKLIPSVYALINIAPHRIGDPKAVGYSGPTFITIRSGKHASSTAFSHAKDLQTLFSMESLREHCRDEKGNIKPVVIIISDGGPDKNPRYEKIQAAAIHHFMEYDLDAIFIATNAPGRSAFNRVERRMAPLSRELSGVILPHDKFGTHLNDQGKTIDKALEQKNFQYAAQTLAEIWNGVDIDGYNTIAMCVPPENSEAKILLSVDATWRTRHVREGHYFFQVIKCNNLDCCKPARSQIRQILPNFMPGPLCINQDNGMVFNDNSDEKNQFVNLLIRLKIDDSDLRYGRVNEIPFDICCLSVKEFIKSRMCPGCGLYHATQKSMKNHKRACTSKSAATVSENPAIPQQMHRRPVRVAAQRQREKMIIWTSRLNDEHIDWVNDEELNGLDVIEESASVEAAFVEEVSFPVINVEQYMQPVWEQDTN